jgi:hypothetical protein
VMKTYSPLCSEHFLLQLAWSGPWTTHFESQIMPVIVTLALLSSCAYSNIVELITAISSQTVVFIWDLLVT